MTGRPSEFTQEIADAICERLAEGASLAEICREDGMPAQRTVFQWLTKHESFAHDYARAREAQADADADAIGDMAAQVRRGELDPTAARVAIDAYKWTAGKRKPKVYGDKIDVTSGGEAMKAPIFQTIYEKK
jgi:transposase-like protein